jgi:hypothetical protein
VAPDCDTIKIAHKLKKCPDDTENDLLIKCNEGKLFLCKRSVLSGRSDYFRVLLNNSMKEGKQNHISIAIDISVLQFIYTKSFQFANYNKDSLLDLFEVITENYFLFSKSFRIELYSSCIVNNHLLLINLLFIIKLLEYLLNFKEKVPSININLLNLTEKISSTNRF